MKRWMLIRALGAIGVIAVAFAAFHEASDAWMWALVAMLYVALVAATLWSLVGPRTGGCAGFAVIGWAYFAPTFVLLCPSVCHSNPFRLTFLIVSWQVRIPPPNSAPASLSRLLRSKGAKTTCYAISSRQDVDARLLPLDEALTLCVGYGLPIILSCLPGRLCYIETEQEVGPPTRLILFRTSPLAPTDV